MIRTLLTTTAVAVLMGTAAIAQDAPAPAPTDTPAAPATEAPAKPHIQVSLGNSKFPFVYQGVKEYSPRES